MEDKRLMDWVQKLENISPVEWLRLKMVIDDYFCIKTRELERQLKLSDDDAVEQVIRSRFG